MNFVYTSDIGFPFKRIWIMLTRVFILFLAFISSSQLWAITCYYTLAKENCWSKYTISVDVIDAMSNKVLTTVTVPEGKMWVRQTFPCEAAQKLMYQARFSPMIWESEKGKVYPAKNYWSLPTEIHPGDTAWNVSVCYPEDFSQVPLPPEATGHCSCDFKSIPVIQPQ